MKSKEKRLLIVKNFVIRIISELNNFTLQDKMKKRGKHTPFALKNDIITDNDGTIFIKVGGSPKCLPLLEYAPDNGIITSYSLSDMTLKEHKQYILNKLNEYLEQIKYNLFDINYEIINVDIFRDGIFKLNNDDLHKYNYTTIYLVNIVPLVPALIYNDINKSIKIANSYIIAIGKNKNNEKIINIMFAYNHKIYATPTHELINEYNNSDRINNIDINILKKIIYNYALMNMIPFHGFEVEHIDQNIKLMNINNILLPPIYPFDNWETSIGNNVIETVESGFNHNKKIIDIFRYFAK